jgi:hypothetical protein
MSRLKRPEVQAPVQAKGMVHELIAETAKDMCAVWYEEAAHDNDFYKKFPSQKGFVRKHWQSFIRVARPYLAELLNDHHGLTPHMKDAIHEALLLNAAVNPAFNQLN